MPGPTLIQIKRSLNTGSTPTLANGELAFTANGDVLFIGSNAVTIAIAGKRTPGVLTANQDICTNTTNMIDQIMLGNTSVNAVVNSTSVRIANSTTGVTLVRPDTTQIAGNYYLKADGSWSTVSAGSAAPAGANTQIQYNDSGVTAGVAAFTYDEVTNNVFIANGVLLGSGTANVTANTSIVRLANSTVTFDLSKPTAAQVTAANYYLASDSTWKQVVASGTLDQLTDVTITSVANNDLIVYDNVAGQWENHAVGNGFSFVGQSIAVQANNGILANATGIWATGANGITVTAAGINVLGNNGISTNSTGTWAVGSNGITVTAAGINVLGNNGLIVNTTGTHVLANNGIVANSTGTWAKEANGTSVTAAGINVNVAGTSGLISNTTGVWVKGANGMTVDASGVGVNVAGATSALVSNTTGVWVKGANGITLTAAGVNVLGNNGISANSTGVWAVGANGITVTAAGINVLANNGIVANTTGLFANIGTTLAFTSGAIGVNTNLAITDLTLTGNLNVTGTLTTVDATNLVVNDSIISLARNNGADTLDIGMYGQYNDGTERFTGLIWDTTTDVYELFANSTVEPTTTVDIAATGYWHSTLYSYLKSGWGTGTFVANATGVTITGNTTYAVAITGNTMSLSTALPGTSGGTGLASYTSQDLLVANTVNGFNKLGIGGAGTVLQSFGGALVYDTLDGGTFAHMVYINRYRHMKKGPVSWNDLDLYTFGGIENIVDCT